MSTAGRAFVAPVGLRILTGFLDTGSIAASTTNGLYGVDLHDSGIVNVADNEVSYSRAAATTTKLIARFREMSISDI